LIQSELGKNKQIARDRQTNTHTHTHTFIHSPTHESQEAGQFRFL
jgi:hypothetical protein